MITISQKGKKSQRLSNKLQFWHSFGFNSKQEARVWPVALSNSIYIKSYFYYSCEDISGKQNNIWEEHIVYCLELS